MTVRLAFQESESGCARRVRHGNSDADRAFGAEHERAHKHKTRSDDDEDARLRRPAHETGSPKTSRTGSPFQLLMNTSDPTNTSTVSLTPDIESHAVRHSPHVGSRPAVWQALVELARRPSQPHLCQCAVCARVAPLARLVTVRSVPTNRQRIAARPSFCRDCRTVGGHRCLSAFVVVIGNRSR